VIQYCDCTWGGRGIVTLVTWHTPGTASTVPEYHVREKTKLLPHLSAVSALLKCFIKGVHLESVVSFTPAASRSYNPPLPRITPMYCPSDNTQAVDQSHFWTGSHWDAHRIGWVVAAICTLVVCAIFLTKMTRVHPHLTTDYYYLCNNRSKTLSVCHGLTFNAPAS